MLTAAELAWFSLASLLLVLTPGPNMIYCVSRALCQGRSAGIVSLAGVLVGFLVHLVAATLGLTALLAAVPFAFDAVRLAGAAYLLWLGCKAIFSRNLISFTPAARQPLRRVFATGLLSNVLNPKPGLFVVAFIPQFVAAQRGSVPVQMLVYGAIFAVLTAVIFTALGCFAAQLSNALARRPRLVLWANIGAGLTFVAAGLSILALDRRR